MSTELNLSLSAGEVQGLLNLLGELPAKSGVWPLMMKIKDQAEAQLAAKDAEVVAEAA